MRGQAFGKAGFPQPVRKHPTGQPCHARTGQVRSFSFQGTSFLSFPFLPSFCSIPFCSSCNGPRRVVWGSFCLCPPPHFFKTGTTRLLHLLQGGGHVRLAGTVLSLSPLSKSGILVGGPALQIFRTAPESEDHFLVPSLCPALWGPKVKGAGTGPREKDSHVGRHQPRQCDGARCCEDTGKVIACQGQAGMPSREGDKWKSVFKDPQNHRQNRDRETFLEGQRACANARKYREQQRAPRGFSSCESREDELVGQMRGGAFDVSLWSLDSTP